MSDRILAVARWGAGRSMLLVAAMVGASLLPNAAYAANPHGVLAGADVKYDGVGPDKILVDVGSVYVDGSATSNPFLGGPVSTTFCTDLGVNLSAHNTVFYMYYAYQVGGANNNYYISTTAPSTDGHPSAVITGSSNLPNGCAIHATTNALFLGSYLTDSSGHIIPFNRNSDEVILTPAQATGGSGAVLTGGVTSTTTSFLTTETYPEKKNIDFSTLGTPVTVPGSATAVILDLTFNDQGNDAKTYAYILDPHWPTLASTNTCTYHSQFTMPNFNLSTSAVRSQYGHAHVRSDGNTIYIGVCAKPTKELDVWVTFYGYVEPINHLTPL